MNTKWGCEIVSDYKKLQLQLIFKVGEPDE